MTQQFGYVDLSKDWDTAKITIPQIRQWMWEVAGMTVPGDAYATLHDCGDHWHIRVWETTDDGKGK